MTLLALMEIFDVDSKQETQLHLILALGAEKR